MKKSLLWVVVLVLSISMVAAFSLYGCKAEEEVAAEEVAAEAKPYIAVISKGFQHQFWQTVAMGAEDAAADYDVDITFDGPPSESDIAIQVDMINAALAKNPAALCLAALDTESVLTQLNDAKDKGIPIIGFDSGVPDAPEGTIISTASTNNEAAGALAADSMFADSVFSAALNAATVDNPVVIGVLSQDATSASITGRTIGYTDQMVEICEGLFPGQVEVTGHVKYEKAATSGEVAVTINTLITPSTSAEDLATGAQTLLAMDNIISVFASNEAAASGILAATTDGTDLDRDTGKYKDLTVVGFDSSKTEKAAVRAGYLLGAISQDPYMIGYLSVELAVKALDGETLDEFIDTGAQFYNADNMDDANIAPLLYD